jgi:hypothetical protein
VRLLGGRSVTQRRISAALNCGLVADCEVRGLGHFRDAIDDLERSRIGEVIPPAISSPLLRARLRVRHSLDQKSRTDQHIFASWSGLDLVSLNHIKPRQYQLTIGRARALMCLSKDTVCRRRLLLFLAGLLCLLRLLRFLGHVALRYPKVGSMQVDLDMHKYRVHHNCKIDTLRFEQGKRRSHQTPFGQTNYSHAVATR